MLKPLLSIQGEAPPGLQGGRGGGGASQRDLWMGPSDPASQTYWTAMPVGGLETVDVMEAATWPSVSAPVVADLLPVLEDDVSVDECHVPMV